jgi:hypothetical protein
MWLWLWYVIYVMWLWLWYVIYVMWLWLWYVIVICYMWLWLWYVICDCDMLYAICDTRYVIVICLTQRTACQIYSLWSGQLNRKTIIIANFQIWYVAAWETTQWDLSLFSNHSDHRVGSETCNHSITGIKHFAFPPRFAASPLTDTWQVLTQLRTQGPLSSALVSYTDSITVQLRSSVRSHSNRAVCSAPGEIFTGNLDPYLRRTERYVLSGDGA